MLFSFNLTIAILYNDQTITEQKTCTAECNIARIKCIESYRTRWWTKLNKLHLVDGMCYHPSVITKISHSSKGTQYSYPYQNRFFYKIVYMYFSTFVQINLYTRYTLSVDILSPIILSKLFCLNSQNCIAIAFSTHSVWK